MRLVELGTCRPRLMRPLRDRNWIQLRLKARLLIEGFDSAQIWGWKDPRNSLTLPFWEDLLPGLKTLIIVRNPAGSRLLDAKAQRNLVCIWPATLGNL